MIQKFPEVIDPLRDGRLCLSTMGELAKALDHDNKDMVLPRFFHLSKREAKSVAAAIRPQEAPPHRDLVMAIRPPPDSPRLELAAPLITPGPGREAAASSPSVVCPDKPTSVQSDSRPPAPVVPAAPGSTIEPLTAELIRIHLTADRRIEKKLEKARDAVSHSHPAAGLAEIIELGLDLLIARHEKRRGLVAKPRATPPPSSRPDYIPAHVWRAVWKREVFGDAWMDKFTRNPRAGPPA